MNSSSLSNRLQPTHEQISERAKILWQERGQPSGHDDEIWFEAERQVAEELERQASAVPASSPAPSAKGAASANPAAPAKPAGTRKRSARAGR